MGDGNRMVSFPYTKSLTANPFVNQGAAILMTDTDTARSLGVPEQRWVYPLGGAGADEPADPRARVAYHRVPALDATVAASPGDDRGRGRRRGRGRALQLLPRHAQAVAPSARARSHRSDLGHRRTVVLRRAREQLPHPLARRHGRAHPRARAAPACSTASACSTRSTTHSCCATTNVATAVSGTRARGRRTATAGGDARSRRRGLRRAGHDRDVLGDVRPRRRAGTWCRDRPGRPKRAIRGACRRRRRWRHPRGADLGIGTGRTQSAG